MAEFFNPFEEQPAATSPLDYKGFARKAATDAGIDPDFYERLIGAESSWNPKAVSPAGAQGIAQFMPATAKRFGLKDSFDPEQSLIAGAKYLKELQGRFGPDQRLMAAGYNAGEGAVEKYGGVPPYSETQAYVKKVARDASPAYFNPFEEGMAEEKASSGTFNPFEEEGGAKSTEISAGAEATYGQEIKKGVKRGVYGLGEAVGGLMQRGLEREGFDLRKPFFDLRDRAIAALKGKEVPESEAKEGLQAQAKSIVDYWREKRKGEETPTERGTLKWYMGQISEQGTRMVPIIAGAFAGAGAAAPLGVMYAEVFGSKYADARKSGRTEAEATQDAAVYGLTETLTEVGPFALATKIGTPLGKRILQAALGEGVSEVFNEALQKAYDAGFVDDKTTVQEFVDVLSSKGALRDYWDSFVIGGALGGGMALAGGRGSREREAREGVEVNLPAPKNIQEEAQRELATEEVAVEENIRFLEMEETGGVEVVEETGEIDPAAPARFLDLEELRNEREDLRKTQEWFEQNPENSIGLSDLSTTVLSDEPEAAKPNFRVGLAKDRLKGKKVLSEIEGLYEEDAATASVAPGQVIQVGLTGEQINQEILTENEALQATDPADATVVEEHQKRISRLEALQPNEEVFSNATDMVQEWVDRFAPGMKVAVNFTPENLNGHGQASFDTTSGMELLEVDPTLLDREYGSQLMREALSHEFGHSLMHWTLKNASKPVHDGVMRDYLSFLQGSRDMSQKEFYARAGTEAEAVVARPGFEPAAASRKGYWFGFNEWFAQQVVRKLNNDTAEIAKLSKGSRNLVAKIAKKLEALYDAFKGKFLPATSVEKWMDGLADMSRLEARGEDTQAERRFLGDTIPPWVVYPETVELTEQLRSGLNPWVEVESPTETGVEKSLDKLAGLEDSELKTASKEVNEYNSIRFGFLRKWMTTPIQDRNKYGKLVPELHEHVRLMDDSQNVKSAILQGFDSIAYKFLKLPNNEQAEMFRELVFKITKWSFEKGGRVNPRDAQGEWTDAFLEQAREVQDEHGGQRFMDKTLDLYEETDAMFRKTVDELEVSQLYELSLSFNNVVEVDGAKVEIDPDQLIELSKQTRDTDLITSRLFGVSGSLYSKDTVAFREALDAVFDQVNSMKNSNYFPYSRFGKYVTVYRAGKDGVTFEGKEYKPGQVFAYMQYEKERDRKKDQPRLTKTIRGQTKGGYIVRNNVLEESTFALAAMPTAIMDKVASDIGLSEGQKDILRQLQIKRHPGMTMLKHMMKRKGTYGFSEDFLRVLTDYGQGTAGHIARIRYLPLLHRNLEQFRGRIRDLGKDLAIDEMTLDGLTNISSSINRDLEYLTKPTNDFAKLRAFVYSWYLGLDVSFAAVNMTQLPITGYSWLAQEFGDAPAVSSLLAGMKKATLPWKKPKEIERLKTGRNGEYWRDLEEVIGIGFREGWLDESYASNLAGIKDAAAINEFSPINIRTSTIGKVTYAMSFLAHVSEGYIRKSMAIASFDLYRKKNPDATVREVADFAKHAIQSTQVEYAKWNRAPFMRGGKAVPFIFMTFMQHMMYFAGGGYGTGAAVRLWLLLLAFAGLEGLPAAGHGFDLFNLANTAFKKLFGKEETPSDIRLEMRNLAEDAGLDPQLAMNGLGSRWGLGALHALNAFTDAVPNVDISSRISMGYLNRGVEEMSKLNEDPTEQWARILTGIGGPTAAIAYNAWEAMHSDETDKFKLYERTMPKFMKSLVRSSRWWEQGYADVGRNKTPLIDFGSGWDGNLTIVALGFQPEKYTEYFRVNSLVRESENYWQNRRNGALQYLRKAYYDGDKKALASAKERLKKLNKDLRSAGLGGAVITASTVKKSIQRGARDRRLKELGKSDSRMWAPMYEPLEEFMEERDQ